MSIAFLSACGNSGAGGAESRRLAVLAKIDAIEARLLGCIDGNALGRTPGLVACNEEAIDDLSIVLNQVVATRQHSAPTREKQARAQSQRVWNEQMVRKCEDDPEYKEFGGGTLAPGTFARVIYGMCVANAHERRIRELVGAPR